MKIVAYFCSLVVTIACIALAFEFGSERFLPENYRGYLVEEDGANVKWAIGPFEPSQPALGFNSPVAIKKPDDTLRIISLGASGTEGWLSAQVVFRKYGQRWEAKDISSFSRVIEFSMNEIADSSAKKIEVINLGIAAYNITDVIRMLKDSRKLDPDLFLIQIGGNETWTAERKDWSSFIDNDIPYLYSEIGYEVFADIQANWKTLATGGNAFNPMVLFNSHRPQPIVAELPGRAEGLVQRLANYKRGLGELGEFLTGINTPILFLLPTQNLADYQPFGSMAKPETSSQQLEELNKLLIAALAEGDAESRYKYLEILELDDGIAEANFQLGKIYLREQKADEARESFWKANDRDLVLKRLPSAFHEISRNFVEQNDFRYLDVMKFYESKSADGVVGYNWLDDDVHPHRQAQFNLGTEIVKTIVSSQLLESKDYIGNLQRLPTFENYNAWTGFDRQAEGTLAYLKAAHNFLTFGRYRQRIRWDPNPEQLLQPIIDNLEIANSYAPSDESRYFNAVLSLYLGRQEDAQKTIEAIHCSTSIDRAAQVHYGMMAALRQIIGNTKPQLREELQRLLVLEGCNT